MAKGTRNIAAAAGMAGFLMMAGTSEAADHEAAPTIVLHVTNKAGVSGADFAAAQAETYRVFDAIGVRTVWRDAAAESDRESSALHLSIALLSPEIVRRRASEGIGDDVLGTASKAAGWAYILCERITALAARTRMDARTLLGRVIAHEIGHLVLPEVGHGNHGIMADGIDRSPSGTFQLTFTPRESRAIHGMLRSRASRSEGIADR